MKNRTFVNRAIAMATAIAVAIQPTTVLATENPTSASTKVTYTGEEHYSIVVPTIIQIQPDGTAEFSVKAEGDLRGWRASGSRLGDTICIPILSFCIASVDENGNVSPGCYLYQDGKEPIFAEFHEKSIDDMLIGYSGKYKDLGETLKVNFCNPLPSWARGYGYEDFGLGLEYEDIPQEAFINYWLGYDMGAPVTIKVNLEDKKAVPAGEWEGRILVDWGMNMQMQIPTNGCDEAKKAYEELVNNGMIGAYDDISIC